MFFHINRIEFMVTYYCTGRCMHCSVGDLLNTGQCKHVDGQAAAKAVRDLSDRFQINSVMTFGGEPLLFPDVVCAIHAQATKSGIPTRQIITNGYFNKDKGKIKETAAALADSGVNNILISADSFHQQIIPLEIVHQFAESAIKSGISNVKLSPAWVVDKDHKNVYNEETRTILSRFSDLDIGISKGNNIFMSGNAVKNLSEFYNRQALDLSLACGHMPYTESLDHISTACIVPNGDVMVCSFPIGNIYEEDINSILTRYNPYENEYMKTILSEGVNGLVQMAADRGLAVDVSQCWSVCEACKTLVQAMNAAQK
jgi:MoaA/NifB/PqqE/SkfB family radical SAM enzyme